MSEKIEYVPFHAINEFMLADFRKLVIKTVLANISALKAERQKAINRHIKKSVNIQGFRDSSQAPAAIKANGSVGAFEKSAAFAAEILAGWSDLHAELAGQVFELLSGRGWELLPVEAERSKLPGFMIRWPAAESFEVLSAAFRNVFPNSGYSDDEVSLMIVWLSNRLPYEMIEDNVENN